MLKSVCLLFAAVSGIAPGVTARHSILGDTAAGSARGVAGGTRTLLARSGRQNESYYSKLIRYQISRFVDEPDMMDAPAPGPEESVVEATEEEAAAPEPVLEAPEPAEEADAPEVDDDADAPEADEEAEEPADDDDADAPEADEEAEEPADDDDADAPEPDEEAEEPADDDDADAPEEVATEPTSSEGDPTPPSGDNCIAPSSLPGMVDVISASKFAAPTDGDQTDQGDLPGFCNEFFQVQDGYTRFMTSSERSELRIPANDDVSDGFVISEATASLEAVLRIVKPEIGEGDNYTFMQLHRESDAYIRLAHYGRKNVEGVDEDAFNHIWLFIKEGDGDLTSISLGAVPTGDFSASIVLPGDGTVTICANGNCETFDITEDDRANYFKVGVYVQDGSSSDFLVDYKSVTYTLSAGENML